MPKSLTLALLCAALSLPAGPALAAAAGEVLLITGRGTASDPASGRIRELVKGDAVYAGEIVSSSINSYINLKFADGSFILLRPNTRFAVEAFELAASAPAPAAVEPIAAPAAASAPIAETPAPADPRRAPAPTTATDSGARAYFRLLKGGFRAVSGLIGKANAAEYRVTTPVATIGIRGTDYVVILCDAACARDPVLGDSIPAGRTAEGGIVVGVIQGGVFVSSTAGPATDVGANQYLATLPDGTQLTLPFEPRFLRVDPIPNPATVCP